MMQPGRNLSDDETARTFHEVFRKYDKNISDKFKVSFLEHNILSGFVLTVCDTDFIVCEMYIYINGSIRLIFNSELTEAQVDTMINHVNDIHKRVLYEENRRKKVEKAFSSITTEIPF